MDELALPQDLFEGDMDEASGLTDPGLCHENAKVPLAQSPSRGPLEDLERTDFHKISNQGGLLLSLNGASFKEYVKNVFPGLL